jgi:hypothetical protein
MAPAAVAWGDNLSLVDVFAVASCNGEIFYNYFGGVGWSGWEAVGWHMCGAPAVVSWGPTRLDVFMISLEYEVRHRAWAGGWVTPDFESLGAAPCGGGFNNDSPLAAATCGANRVDVFAVGADGQMYHKYWAPPSSIAVNEVIEAGKHAS